MKKYVLGCGGILVLLVLIVFLGGCGGYNRLVRLSQETDSSWAQVQSQYQRRYDLIPNLVKTVEGAANFEKSTLMEITAARASVGQVNLGANQAPADAAQLERFQKAQDHLSSTLSRLLVVVERYPELRANNNFMGLQTELAGTENRIAVERMRFNEAVKSYNTAVKQFPGVLLAGMFGYQTKPYFQPTAGSEVPPKVDFNFGAPKPSPAKP